MIKHKKPTDWTLTMVRPLRLKSTDMISKLVTTLDGLLTKTPLASLLLSLVICLCLASLAGLMEAPSKSAEQLAILGL